MICQFCNATMDEQNIYGVMKKNDFIVTCKRCYPVKIKNQKCIKEFEELKEVEKNAI